jgi:hypothetical protein
MIGEDTKFLLRAEARAKGSATNPSPLDKEVTYAVVFDAALSMAKNTYIIYQLYSSWAMQRVPRVCDLK